MAAAVAGSARERPAPRSAAARRVFEVLCRGMARNVLWPKRKRARAATRAVLLGLTLCLTVPAAAGAAPSRKKAIWGPVTVNGKSQFPIYHDLGAGIYQIQLSWPGAAP